MTTSHENPAQSPEAGEVVDFARELQDWASFLHKNSIYDLVRLGDPEETPDGIIEAVETPEGLVGDAAIVTMPRGMKSDTPHLHHDELEGHVVISGSALMVRGSEVLELKPGDTFIVDKETPHYTVPSEAANYVEVAVSKPGYKPGNQEPIDLANPPYDLDLDLYAQAQARA